MTIPTPTSEGLAGLAGAVPAGLPDEVTLARLAGEFFAALPTGFGGASALSLPNAPRAPAPEIIPPGNVGPTLTAAAPVAPVRAESVPIDHASAAGRPGAPALGVPEAYAAALPTFSPPVSPPPLAPSTPYYFLGEAGAFQSAPQQAAHAAPRAENRSAAQSFGLPGEAELHSILAELAGERRTASVPGSSTASPYYFLDTQNVPKPEADVPATPSAAHPAFDVHAVRRDFPILQERVNGRQLIWFDNAATTHKPQAVIDRLAYFYQHENSNIHRAAHELAARATDAYEGARNKVARFLGAASSEEIIFVRGTTEGINLVAQCYARPRLREGDEILITELEHHSNIVPWQMVALATGAKLVVAPVNDAGEVTEDAFSSKLSTRTKMVSFAHVSNALGTILPAKRFVQLAKSVGAAVCIDGAQAAPHAAVDVQDLGCDFYAFSGHKVYGPTGIGVLYGRRELLEEMIPYQGGGDMIDRVTFAETTWNALPYKFEAGTPHIAGGIGLGAALDYLTALDPDAVAAHERDVLAYGTAQLAAVPGLRLVGTAAHKVGVLSFLMEGAHPSDVGTILDQVGVAVRTGHHCTQPLMDRFGIPATARASMALYSTRADIDALVRGLHLVREMFA